MFGDSRKKQKKTKEPVKPINVAQLLATVGTLARRRPAPDDAAGSWPMPADRSGLIDVEGAMKRLGGDRGLFREFIQVFDEDAPGLLESLRQAVAGRDAVQVERAAHSLRGLVANFGARPVAEAARHMEERGKSGQWERATQALEKLTLALAQLDEALEEHRVQG
jgi:HPt (histidine-containing phosphotransfer) domain-containing protein